MLWDPLLLGVLIEYESQIEYLETLEMTQIPVGF